MATGLLHMRPERELGPQLVQGATSASSGLSCEKDVHWG